MMFLFQYAGRYFAASVTIALVFIVGAVQIVSAAL
jgi:hypothetical protein